MIHLVKSLPVIEKAQIKPWLHFCCSFTLHSGQVNYNSCSFIRCKAILFISDFSNNFVLYSTHAYFKCYFNDLAHDTYCFGISTFYCISFF